MTAKRKPERSEGTPKYSFTALVGQEQMKLALMLHAINPRIGGVLIRGEKGTGKSTAVRALAELLPQSNGVEQGFSGLFTLPLGATEDMVVGSLDFEAAVKTGQTHFLPGLLKRAHQGILYVDEVNLLDDHLVDCILDAAESGENAVEREGISFRHPSHFVLVGTMNPEEGELRPQLLDRFGLAVEVHGVADPELRVELVRRREQFDLDHTAFEQKYQRETQKLKDKLKQAKDLLGSVYIPRHLQAFICEIAGSNNVAGHRADLAIERASRAHAAYHGRTEVNSDDIIEVAPMALLHRVRNDVPPQVPPPPPPEDGSEDDDQQNTNQDQSENQEEQQTEQNFDPDQSAPSQDTEGPDQNRQDSQPQEDQSEEIHEIGEPFKVKRFASQKDKVLRTGSGRRSRTRSATRQGRYVKSTSRRARDDLALDATLRAAAPFQIIRQQNNPSSNLTVHIVESDIREKIRERRVGNILLFVVDGSGSMGAQKRMVETKATIMSLLLDAYQKRDKVALIVFRGREAQLVLPPTSSVDLAGKLLAELPIGGRTPLSAGLVETSQLLERISHKEPHSRPLVFLLTDGKANAAIGEELPPHKEALRLCCHIANQHENTRFVVVDTEPNGVVRLGLARQVADGLGADYFHPDDLQAEDLIRIAREHA